MVTDNIHSALRDVQPIRKTLWDESFETGIPKLDSQHKDAYFVAIRLLNADRKEMEKILKETFTFLNLFVVEHYGLEEELMQKYKYCNFEKHHARHLKLKQQFEILQTEYSFKGYNDVFAKKMDDFMIEILESIVEKDDLEFTCFLKNELNSNFFKFINKINPFSKIFFK